MKQAVVNDITLEYEVSGRGEAVVFIHGAFLADTFGPLVSAPELANRFQMITYHRRGYEGSSPVSGITSIKQQVMDCIALLLNLEVRRAHVVGHSFGGCVALQLALTFPETVQSLALLEPALAVGSSAQGYHDALVKGQQRFRDEGPEGVIDEFMKARWPDYRSTLDQVVLGGFANAVAHAPAFFESDIGLLDWHFGEEEARSINLPTLVVLGGGSVTLSPRFEDTYQSLLEWIPAAEGVILPQATHFLHLERPSTAKEMTKALRDFWVKHSGTGTS